jgi:hypothetical protein
VSLELDPASFEQARRAGYRAAGVSRVRLGGQLRFTSPEDEIFGEEGEERRPEIRFESAFRF